ncbi:MAG: hypothetical protein U9Q30_10485 [Campylobacterota bacterium]|nr:hypothetical protein [Campylobacterota bacterium]
MKNQNIYYRKKLAKLKYQDEIIELSKSTTIREITKIINHRLAYTKLKVTLSVSTINNIINKGKNNE